MLGILLKTLWCSFNLYFHWLRFLLFPKDSGILLCENSIKTNGTFKILTKAYAHNVANKSCLFFSCTYVIYSMSINTTVMNGKPVACTNAFH